MELHTLLRNGSRLSLLFSTASALFLSPRGWYPVSGPKTRAYRLCGLCAPISMPSVLRFFLLYFHVLTNPLLATPLLSHPYKTGGAPPTQPFSPCASFRIQSSCSASVASGRWRNPTALWVPRVIMRGVTAMRSRPRRRCEFASAILSILICLGACSVAHFAHAQERRDREPNSVYAERRAKLAAQIDCPIVLWGLTGREESSQTYIFEQEENFYYLTGHNEEGAGLVIFPAKSANDSSSGPREIFYLPAKNPMKERWNGVRMSPADPGIEARTGFATVKPFAEMRAEVEELAKTCASFYTILPYQKELGGYPHEKELVDWLQQVAPQIKLKDIRLQISTLRQIKSPGELAFLQRAIDLSLDAHLEAMRMMRPGLYEYQVAAKMVEVHQMGGSEAEGYAPIVGAGPNSTTLHYDRLSRKIEDADIVVLDVGAQFSGYSADITRTLPANGKFMPRQREI